MKQSRLFFKQSPAPFFLLFLVSLLNIFTATDAYAWRPLISIAGGAVVNGQLGETQSFPIQNPVTDEYYNYRVKDSIQATTAYDGFVGVEWNVYPLLYLQTGFNFNQSSSMNAQGSFDQGADVQSQNTYSYNYNVLARQYLLEGKLLYTLAEIYHPYVLLGAGVSYTNTYGYSTSVPANLTFTRIYTSKIYQTFSYALGIGADVNIAPDFRFGFMYRFADAGKSKFGSAFIDTTTVSGVLTQNHVYTNQILAQMTYEC